MLKFAAAARRWLEQSSPEHSREWQVKCAQYVKRIVDFWPDDDAAAIDRGELMRFRKHLLGLGLANATVNHYLATCKQILRECHERREIDHMPHLRALTPAILPLKKAGPKPAFP